MNMKKTALAVATTMALGMSTSTAQAITISWSGAAVQEATFLVPHGVNGGTTSAYTPGFSSGGVAPGFEFRTVVPGGTSIGGGTPGGGFSGVEKDVTFGTESWTFNGGGAFTGVAGTPGNPGATTVGAPAGPSAAPTANTNPTIGQHAFFVGLEFNFLAPVTGSLAANAYGTGSISFGTGDAFSITMPVLEGQWSSKPFKLGTSTGGITFDCIGAVSGNVACHAEHLVDASEEQGVAFTDWTFQWDLHGTMTPQAVPVPAAAWLFTSGLVGLMGIAKKRKA